MHLLKNDVEYEDYTLNLPIMTLPIKSARDDLQQRKIRQEWHLDKIIQIFLNGGNTGDEFGVGTDEI